MMKRTMPLLLALAVFVLAAVSTNAADPPGPSKTNQGIVGTVKDDKGNPVEGAEVVLMELSIRDISGKPGATTKTDAAGKFKFEHARVLNPQTDQGATLLIASKPGFAWCGKGIESPQSLPAGGLDLKLEAPQSLAGRIVNTQGQPVAGAMVYPLTMKRAARSAMDVLFIMPGMDRFAAKTDADGKFRFEQLPGGCRVGFQIRHPDYANLSVFPQGSAQGFESGQTDIKLELARPGKIQGQLLDEAKKPVAGVSLTANLAQPQAPFGNTATTDAAGRYEFKNLGPGAYTIAMPPALENQKTRGLVEPRSGINLAEGQTLTGIDLSMTRGCLVTGLVFNQKTGKGVPGARIFAYMRKGTQSMPSWNGSAKTDDKGRFELRAPAGTISVQANAENYAYDYTQGPKTVEAKAGDEPADVQIALAPNVAKVIKGLVVGPDGKPAAGATVRQGSSFGGQNGILSGPDGRFELKQTRQMVGGMSEDQALYAFLPEKSLAAMVPVESDKDQVELTIKLQPAGIVTGRVLGEDKKPLTKASVQLERYVKTGSGGMVYGFGDPVSVDRDGRYRINTLCDGATYWLNITAEGCGSERIQDLTAESAKTIDKGETTLMRADLYVDGVILDQFGQPVQGARIYYYGQKQPEYREVNTDSAGKFHIGPLVAGELRINANKEGYGYASSELILAKGANPPVEIEMVNENGQTTRLTPGATAPKLEGVEWLSGNGDLAALKGRPVALIFFTSGNRPCVRGLEKLAALGKEKLAVIAIGDASQPAADIKQFMEKKGLNITFGRASDPKKMGWASPAFRAYEVRSVPGITLIDGSGKIRAANISLNDLDKALGELTGAAK